MRRHGVLLVTFALALSLVPLLAGGPAGARISDAADAVAAQQVSPEILQRLTRPPGTVPLPAIPANPVAALVTAANAHSASVGFLVDHGPAITSSGIQPAFAGRLALLMQAVLSCSSALTEEAKLDCEAATNDAAAGVLRTSSGSTPDIKAWPSLYVDGNGSKDHYVHDYAVLVDTGGNDTYDNNAGGNLMDHRRGPSGSAAPINAAAIGCEQVQGNFPAPNPATSDCIAAPQVVLIDKKRSGRSSDDVYGVLKSPRQTDHNPPPTGPSRLVDGDCTNSKLVRRIVLQGSGFEGNGLLIDSGGSDRYLGKTAAQGSGHVGGVGVLRDLGGTADRYRSIRNSQGFALVGILGVLQDDGGADRYDGYMPAPKDPNAAFQEPGSGGVVDDTGLCDNMPRMMQGTALAGGVGLLLEQNGADTYVGAPADTQPFNPSVDLSHSSQGFGCATGVGILRDRGRDDDRYLNGPGGRTDGVSFIQPELECEPASTPGVSIFEDDGR